MHGVKRSKADQNTTISPEEEAKLNQYIHLNQDLLSRHALKRYSEKESLDLSTSLLAFNPEHVTAWSFRRHCLLALYAKKKTNDEDQDRSFDETLQAELSLTLASFQRNPKAYPIWEHRKWTLAHLSKADWQAELNLLEKIFKLDGRNFHAWDYRRYVISETRRIDHPSSRLDDQELEFSAQQIESNFSNFSAWHYRSKLLESRLNQLDDDQERRLRKELEWVRGALWIDPNDQSAWLYHRWLLNQTQNEEIRRAEFHSIEELLEVEPDSKWAMTALLMYDSKKYSYFIDRLLALDPLRKQRYLDCARHSAAAHPS